MGTYVHSVQLRPELNINKKQMRTIGKLEIKRPAPGTGALAGALTGNSESAF
jgi:hypothetical protein